MTGASASSNSLENSTNNYQLSKYVQPCIPHTPIVSKFRGLPDEHTTKKFNANYCHSIYYTYYPL